MKNLFLFIALLATLVGVPNATYGQTINKFVTDNGGKLGDGNYFDFDILRRVLAIAELTPALQDREAQLTLLAPNDLAFVVLARDLGFTGYDERGALNHIVGVLTQLGEGDPIPPLRQILLYHVVPERLDIYELLFREGPIHTVQGGSFTVRPFLRLADQESQLTDPRLFFPLNNLYRNGVVHAINRVLFPFDLDL